MQQLRGRGTRVDSTVHPHLQHYANARFQKYNVHTDRHIIGTPMIVGRSAGVITIEASFLVMQADAEGVGAVFAFGRYIDEVVSEAGEMRFRSKIAIVDNFEIPRAISTPI